MNIGIVGYLGVVGNALYQYYMDSDHRVWGVDKAHTSFKDDLALMNEHAEVVMVCVGTPYDPSTGLLDCSQVLAAVDALTGEKTVIIKSTVNPGTTDWVQARHKRHRVFFVPEFLSADTAVEDYANPRRPHVVGYDTSKASDWDFPSTWALWYDILPGFPSGQCVPKSKFLPARQAELLKLSSNAFYALKVTFANQMFDLGMTQETLDALAADPWIVASHFTIMHKGSRGYGGACLPKDTATVATLLKNAEWTTLEGYNLATFCTQYNNKLKATNATTD